MIKTRAGQVVGTTVVARTIIRKAEVQRRTGLSDTTLWRREKSGTFPPRVQITESGLVGWIEAEVDRWIHDRVRGGGKRPPRADRAA